MKYAPQVTKKHYEGSAYRSGERWISYFHQMALVRAVHPKNILEVGVGEGVVARELRANGFDITTVDIAEDLHPDVVGSVMTLPFPDNAYDCVLAAEVLEHIRFEDSEKALSEIARVTRKHAVISIPHPGWVFSFVFKIPLLPKVEVFFQIPFFWKTHVFNGEHYWELGKKGYPVRRFIQTAKDAGLSIVSFEKFADDPAHRFFLFSKKI